MAQHNCTVTDCIYFGRYCRIHKKDTVKIQQPIAAMGDNRKELEKEYKPLRKEFLRQNPMCAEPGCKQPATDIHHMAGKIGLKLIDVDDFIQFCRKHHSYYEVRPNEAKEKGFSKSRLKDSKLSHLKTTNA